MDAKELRIGNLVTDEFYESFKTIIEVDSINDYGINLQIEDDGNYPECAKRWIEPYYGLDVLRPISLTEEWLLKFGFKNGNSELSNCDLWNHHWIGGFEIVYYNEYFWFEGMVKLEFVHQLQNLYFALTGEELTIKS